MFRQNSREITKREARSSHLCRAHQVFSESFRKLDGRFGSFFSSCFGDEESEEEPKEKQRGGAFIRGDGEGGVNMFGVDIPSEENKGQKLQKATKTREKKGSLQRKTRRTNDASTCNTIRPGALPLSLQCPLAQGTGLLCSHTC